MFRKKISKVNFGTNINTDADNLFHNGREQENISVEESKKESNVFTGVFDKVMAVSLFMIFLGVPLFFTGFAFQGIVFEKQIYFYFWILLALVSWVAKGVITGEMRIRKTPLDIPILVFWVVYGLATFFSIDKWHSFWGFFGDPSRGLVSLTAVIIAYYLIVSNYTVKRMTWMVAGLVISSLIVSTWSLFSFLGVRIVPNKIGQYIPLSLIGSVAGLKIFIGMMIPIITMVSLKLSEHKNKVANIVGYILLIFIPINLALISIFYQRTIALIVLTGVGLFLLYILSNIVRSKKKMSWAPMLVFILATVVLIIGNNNFARISSPIEISPDAKISWEVAKSSLKEHLFVGTGPASYGFNFSKYRPEVFNNNIFYNLRFYQGNGLFFEALSTIGILGIVALLAVITTVVNVAIYLISKDKNNDKLYSLGLFSALIIVIAGLFFMRLEGTILILGGVLGALTIATMLQESNVEERYLSLSLKASPKFALTLAFIFIVVSAGVATLFVYIGKAYTADIYAGKDSRSQNVLTEDSIKNILRAISLNKREGRYYSRASQEYMMLANQSAVKFNGKEEDNKKNIEKVKNYLDSAFLYAREGVKYMPEDALAVSALAQINESLAMYTPGALNVALENYNKLSELEPNSPVSYMKIGQIKMSSAVREKDKTNKKKLLEEANDNFQKAVDKKKNLGDGYFYLSLVKNALSDKNGAIASMIQAVKTDQNNMMYLFNLGRLYQDRDEKGDLDDAQKIFEYILTVNEDDVNTNFTLALLYEKKNNKDRAIKRYNKVIDLMSKSKDKNRDNIIKQLKKMIENVKNGINNNDAVLNSIEAAKANSTDNTNEQTVEKAVGNLANPAQNSLPTTTNTNINAKGVQSTQPEKAVGGSDTNNQ